MAVLLDGRIAASQIKDNIKSEVVYLTERVGITPHLVVVIVGEDAASQTYVRSKQRACEAVGIRSTVLTLPENITEQALFLKIVELNNRYDVDGILVQLPLPKHIDSTLIMRSVKPSKDVDGFHPFNVGLLNSGLSAITPCTPMGILSLLTHYEISLEGQHVVILGRSEIVGKPMAQLCLNQNATVTICHSKTKNLKQLTRQADVLIVAIGKAHFITADMIKPGSVVVDVGINRQADGRLVGDVDFASVEPVAGFLTPVPGGVGPMTIATLLSNTIKCSKHQS